MKKKKKKSGCLLILSTALFCLSATFVLTSFFNAFLRELLGAVRTSHTRVYLASISFFVLSLFTSIKFRNSRLFHWSTIIIGCIGGGIFGSYATYLYIYIYLPEKNWGGFAAGIGVFVHLVFTLASILFSISGVVGLYQTKPVSTTDNPSDE